MKRLVNLGAYMPLIVYIVYMTLKVLAWNIQYWGHFSSLDLWYLGLPFLDLEMDLDLDLEWCFLFFFFLDLWTIASSSSSLYFSFLRTISEVHGEAVPVPCKTCVWQNICYSISTQGWHSLHANLYKTFTFLSLPFEFQQGVFWLIVWVRRRRTIMSAFFFLSPAMLWFFLLLFLLFNLADWCILLGWFSIRDIF